MGDDVGDVHGPALRSTLPGEVIEALAQGAFRRLLGAVEDERVEFKERYDQSSTRGKRDLVADIAAFANTGGGIIVLGVRTKEDETTAQEYCDEVVGTQPLLTEDWVGKVLSQHSHPPVRGVRVRSYRGPSTRDDRQVTVQVIEIPAGRDEDKPILVDRLVSDDDKNVAHAVGWPYRDGARTEWVSPARIQQLIHFAQRPLLQQMAELPELPLVSEDYDTREGWADWARLVVRLIPQGSQPIPEFHTTFRDLANRDWTDLRPSSFGFRLSSLNPLKNLGGDLVAETPRTILRIKSDGLVDAAALAAPHFLGWAQHQNEEPEHLTQLIINPYPLVEFCAETVRLAYELVGPAAKPVGWKLNARFDHLQDRVPVMMKTDAYFGEVTPATTQAANVTIESGQDWQHDAYRLIDELVGQAFGLRANQIPLLKDGIADPSLW